jgi:hypothetical protein
VRWAGVDFGCSVFQRVSPVLARKLHSYNRAVR